MNKSEVKKYWNKRSCGTEYAIGKKYSREYFDSMEKHRYEVEPEILSFAEFGKYKGKKILEVGVGAGTDFLQWVRLGAKAYGIDLTEEGIENVKKRLKIYKLKAKELKKADCENIPYKDNSFDLVYSWGVIHHTPDTEKALSEIIRVCKKGGECKIMVYHRRSLVALWQWLKRPWKGIKWCIANFMESPGTKAYTVDEMKNMLSKYKIKNLKIDTTLTVYDTLELRNDVFSILGKVMSFVLGKNKAGWFMTISFIKI